MQNFEIKCLDCGKYQMTQSFEDDVEVNPQSLTGLRCEECNTLYNNQQQLQREEESKIKISAYKKIGLTDEQIDSVIVQ
jgi:uncharacterized Zn finger protein